MATFALIHGGGGSGWDWHLVAARLRELGHEAVTPDLPIEDRQATLRDFTDTVVAALGAAQDVVVVGHSYGGFTAPLVAERIGARLLVFVAGMVPAPGEPPRDWWGNVGFSSPEGLSPVEQFQHDVPAELVEEGARRGREQASAEYAEPWPGAALPDVPTRALVFRDDRFFSADLQRRVARERLGIVADELDGSHVALLSRPNEVAERLVSYLSQG
ncbi:alpha/beta hydrolase family protein [Amycolatopsis sulphurea]|uniref:Alpha/beta hydrolase family protein n=1 Tax=Amycolatopsis sulphurea TaxID=76022 RepID=A0A2A9FC27_9PSEU|nr:alpha/beta hydrolase [Amycolatopsis sulphurea]PFG47989.1 alpha/beta hydrolase family protein [Amycolatopsis sulphurea]